MVIVFGLLIVVFGWISIGWLVTCIMEGISDRVFNHPMDTDPGIYLASMLLWPLAILMGSIIFVMTLLQKRSHAKKFMSIFGILRKKS